DIHSRHRRPITAAPHGTTADKTQTGVIEIVAVEVIDSHGCGSGTDETINDKVVEQSVDAHIAVAEKAFADQPAGISQSLLETLAVAFGQEQQPHMLENKSRQDHHPSALLLEHTAWIKVFDSRGQTFIVRRDTGHFAI